MEPIEYDPSGRMRYHPEFHENHGKPFTEEELCYLAKFFKHDGGQMISFALGKTEQVVKVKYRLLEKERKLSYYRSLDYYV